MRLEDDVYAFSKSQLALLTKGETLSEQFIARLRRLNIEGVYIDDGKTPPAPNSIQLEPEQTKKAVDTVQTLFNDIAAIGGSGEIPNFQAVSSIVGGFAQTVGSKQNLLLNISKIKSYDDYTYHHSVSVSVMSMAVGMYMQLPKLMLHRLGLTSILHDIGKVMVPLEILNKPSRLTQSEMASMREHAILGAQYLNKSDTMEEDIIRGVLEHHERVDGCGYPKNLRRKDISAFARIISVVDVYDALTSFRPYRSPMPPGEAAEYLMSNADLAFDMDIVKIFMKKVEFYPIGSFVRLSSGKIARVIDNQNALRPVVQTNDGEYLDLFRDKSCCNITIVGCMSRAADLSRLEQGLM